MKFNEALDKLWYMTAHNDVIWIAEVVIPNVMILSKVQNVAQQINAHVSVGHIVNMNTQ